VGVVIELAVSFGDFGIRSDRKLGWEQRILLAASELLNKGGTQS